MAVGKSSIQRVKKAATGVNEETAVAAEVKTEVEEKPVKKTEPKKVATTKKTAAKKPAEKKAPAKEPAAKKAAPKKDDIHEKKFEMIDGIYSELPTYLL